MQSSTFWIAYRNYNSGLTPKTSRKNETWKANNIYDLAGNAIEWTQEARYTGGRVSRGGSSYYLGSERPASGRNNNNPNNTNVDYSSRPALYLALNVE